MNPQKMTAALVVSLSMGLGLVAPANAAVSEEEFARVTQQVDILMDQLTAQEGFAPGSVVVVATAEGRRWVRSDGVLNVETGAEATAESQFYIASMTKAYMGLLAQRLHEEGVLSLDAVLTDFWPELVLPEDRDASAITLRYLITHQIAIEVEEIVTLEAYIRDVAPSEYPGLIEDYAIARDEGFQYGNLGYNIYGAILEQHTDRNWRDWLSDTIFAPNGMSGTSGRGSDFDPANIAWGHQIDTGIAPVWPTHDGWHMIPPKTDGMMQSAGGLMTTGGDLATWMTMNLSQNGNGLSTSMFEQAQHQWVDQEGDGHGFSCDGYSFGWNNCVLIYEHEAPDGEIPSPTQLLQHGGGYTGYSSLITLAPEMGIGVAVAFNTDGLAGFAALEISKTVFEVALDLQGTDERATARADRYAQFVPRLASNRQNRMEETMAEERWGEGEWSPSTAELEEYVGHYEGDNWLSTAEIRMEEGALRAWSHDLSRYFVPVSQDVFAAFSDGAYIPERIAIVRDAQGEITGIDWDDTVLERVGSH